MDDIISHTSWMRDIPDDTRVTTLSIPGTHDSCSIEGPLGFAKTQNLDLADQLTAGIRFLDIRLAHYQDNLFAHHNAVHMEKSYADILDICSTFLRKHPTEAVLMSVKEEERFDSVLGRFAPSESFGKFRRDPVNWVIRSSSFEDAFKARTWQHIEDPSLFYNFPAPLPDDGSVVTNHTLTSETTLGEIRGKIVLLRRFEAAEDVGSDFTHWPKNRHFRSDKTLIYNVEDCYLNPGEDNKYDCLIAHIDEARRGEFGDFYIAFASAVGMKSSRYSKIINKYLNAYLSGLPRGRIGIIVMDYFEQPRKLVSNVIKMNERIDNRRPASTRSAEDVPSTSSG
ncbi:MAG: phosphatidylinositol-specific phospholipase C [Pseudonocardiaceae bacterium]